MSSVGPQQHEGPPTPPLGISSVDSKYSDNGRKSRYALAYFRSICAQAGVSIAETEPDEDIMAVDVEVRFPRLTARVQIKATSKFKLSGKSLTMDLEPAWVASWKNSFAPVYFVVVVVPPTAPEWIKHSPALTTHKAGAFWERFDPAIHTSKITVPKSQRLTLDTLHSWKSDVDQTLGVGGGAAS